MENDISMLPGAQYYEYVLVLSPQQHLLDKIDIAKKHFAEIYNAQTAINGKAHIVLVKFVQRQMMEDKILTRLKNIADSYSPFQIELKDYGVFPTHTIYININTKVALQDLVRRLHTLRPWTKSEEVKPHFIMAPFIPLAQNLLPWQFEQGWLEMRRSFFSGRFTADGMQLLKRKQGDKKYYLHKKFNFLNITTTTKQSNLFI